jgi:hypothetical protein
MLKKWFGNRDRSLAQARQDFTGHLENDTIEIANERFCAGSADGSSEI